MALPSNTPYGVTTQAAPVVNKPQPQPKSQLPYGVLPPASASGQGPPGPDGPQGEQGIQGIPGTNGINGTNGTNGTNGANADVTRASTTSLLIALGAQTFVYTASSANLGWSIGTRLRAASAANTANYMEGAVTAVSGTQVTVTVDAVGGSGTHADWNIFIIGQPGSAAGGSDVLQVQVFS